MDLDPQHNNAGLTNYLNVAEIKIVKVSQQDSKMNRNLCLVIPSLAGASGGAQSCSKRKDKCSVSKYKVFCSKGHMKRERSEAGWRILVISVLGR